MHLLRAFAALALIAVLVSACGDDDQKVAPPGEATQPVRATEATSEPTDTAAKPALPHAATKPTKAGAEAFIYYYWDVVNHAQATGKTQALQNIVAPACDTCDVVIQGFRKLYRSGGRLLGGANVAQITEIKPQDLGTSNLFAFKVTQVVHNEAETVIYGDGHKEERAEGEHTFVGVIVWVDSAWRIDVQDVLPQ